MAVARAFQVASGRFSGQPKLLLKCGSVSCLRITHHGNSAGVGVIRDFSRFLPPRQSVTGLPAPWKSLTNNASLKPPLSSQSWSDSPSTSSSIYRPLAQVPPQGSAYPGWRQAFHTSARRPIHPMLWILIKPLAKFGAILGGRFTRKWWRNLSEEQRSVYHGHLWSRWYVLVALAAMMGGTAVWYYRSHIEETPITGRRRFVAFTHDQLIAIVEAEAENILEDNKDNLLSPDVPQHRRVMRVVRRLAVSNQDLTGMEEQQWKVHVVKGEEINAFVMPSGDIFVYTGLLDFVQNDDQLGIVLGHEMAHALLSHSLDQISYAQWIDFFIIATMAAMWLIIPSDGIAVITQWFYHRVIELLLHMPYSRMLEKEADRVGLELAAKACFDVREGVVFWKLMGFDEKLKDPEERIPEWLSTHPANDSRVDFLNFLIPKAIDVRASCQCPRLPAMDPRDRTNSMAVIVDNAVLAKKSGQNLQRLTTFDKPK